MTPEQERLIANLKTPEECDRLAINAEARGNRELARAACRKAIELRAQRHGEGSDVGREALEAVYAYERAMSQARRRNFRANRTWQAIKHRGLTEAVEYTVNRPTISMGFTTLVAMGMEDKTFEAVVLRHPEMFSSHAVERSRLKLPQMVLPAH